MKTLPVLLIVLLLFSSLVSAAPEKKLHHDIHISSIIITAESLRCSKEVLVLVDVANEGTFTEDIYIELLNKPLGVHAFSSSVKVRPRSREQILLPLYFSEEPQGTYTFDAYLYTGKDIQEAFQSFTFAGCKTVQLTSFIQDQPPVTLPRQSSPQDNEEPLDLLFLGTLLLIVILVILACTAMLRMF